MEFKERTEAAAFVAALSRFLNSPSGTSFSRSDEPAEVWAAASGRLIHVLLSVPAFKAASEVFAPLPAGSRSEGGLPAGSVLLIQSGTPALGVEEVLNLLPRAAL